MHMLGSLRDMRHVNINVLRLQPHTSNGEGSEGSSGDLIHAGV